VSYVRFLLVYRRRDLGPAGLTRWQSYSLPPLVFRSQIVIDIKTQKYNLLLVLYNIYNTVYQTRDNLIRAQLVP